MVILGGTKCFANFIQVYDLFPIGCMQLFLGFFLDDEKPLYQSLFTSQLVTVVTSHRAQHTGMSSQNQKRVQGLS